MTYGIIPDPTIEQQADFCNRTEQLILCFVSKCIFANSVAELDQLFDRLKKGQYLSVHKEFIGSLCGSNSFSSFNTAMATLLAIHKNAIEKNETLFPDQVFKLVFNALQIADQTNNMQVIAKPAFEWLCGKWTFIRVQQLFQLKSLGIHEMTINNACIAEGSTWANKTIDLLQAILPIIGLPNEGKLNQILEDMRAPKS